MFLWARLVLAYISKNMFYTKDEILSAVQTLPRELSDLYASIPRIRYSSWCVVTD